MHLDAKTRTELKTLTRKENSPAAKVQHARVLLLADEDHVDGQRPDTYIAEVVGISLRSVIHHTKRPHQTQTLVPNNMTS